MNHIPFPSIEAFRHVVAYVRKVCDYHGVEYPKISFVGKVKLHGTNAAVRHNEDGSIVAQSRERDLRIERDNFGFAAFVKRHERSFRRILPAGCIIYGEWIGKGIQKKVAISELDRRFVAFAYWKDGNFLFPHLLGTFEENNGKLYSYLHLSPSHDITIDFARPEDSIEELERMCREVENRCPYAAAHGVNGIGEGLVYSPFDDTYLDKFEFTRLLFKVKGDAHSGSRGDGSKVKVPLSAEKIENMKVLVEKLLPEWRLAQGISVLKERALDQTKNNTGEYIKWVLTDVLKEEADYIVASGFDWKIIAKELTKVIRAYWCKEAF